MALISTEDAKAYLRVDSSDEDATVGILLASAIRLCIDIARLTDNQWEVIDSDAASSDEYTEAELSAIRETMKVAILYTCAYLFEHREEADHHALTMTLRSLLFAIREGASTNTETTKPAGRITSHAGRLLAQAPVRKAPVSSSIRRNRWTSPAATALSLRLWNRQNTGSSRKAAPTTSPM